MTSGGGTTTLNSWTIITAVPEPVTLALEIFAFMLTAWFGLKWIGQRCSRVSASSDERKPGH
jgi:hypothetical protein